MADGGASGPFKRQTSNQMTLNETKQSNQQSALSGNKKFAEDVDEESDEDSSEDHGPTVYMYKCPVFRVSIFECYTNLIKTLKTGFEFKFSQL